MSTHPYPRRPELRDAAFSHEITAAFPPLTKFTVRCSGNDCVIDFPVLELDRDQIDALNDVVANYSGLATAKLRRLEAADIRTREILDVVFTTGVGTQTDTTEDAKTFRASLNAARDMGELDAIADNRT